MTISLLLCQLQLRLAPFLHLKLNRFKCNASIKCQMFQCRPQIFQLYHTKVIITDFHWCWSIAKWRWNLKKSWDLQRAWTKHVCTKGWLVGTKISLRRDGKDGFMSAFEENVSIVSHERQKESVILINEAKYVAVLPNSVQRLKHRSTQRPTHSHYCGNQIVAVLVVLPMD